MRVTESAQRAVTQAKQEAGRLGHDRVGTEHLLLGLLHDDQCRAVATLGELGIAPELARRRVEETVGQGPGEPGLSFGLPTTKAFTLVLALAGRETMQLEHDRLGTQELLLGLAREGEGVAARVLQDLGGGLLELREAVAAQDAAGVAPEPFPPDRGPPPWEPPPSAVLRRVIPLADRAGTKYVNRTSSHPNFGMVRIHQRTFVPSPPAGTELLELRFSQPDTMPGQGTAAAGQHRRPAVGLDPCPRGNGSAPP